MKYINYLFIFLFTFTFLNAALLSAQESSDQAAIFLPEVVEKHELPARGLFLDFQATEQGVLTIFAEVFENTDEGEAFVNEDIIITLHDKYGQEIERINRNHGGQLYAEQGTLTIPDAGEYAIGIQKLSVVEARLYYGREGAEELIENIEMFGMMRVARVRAFFTPSSPFSSLGVSAILDKDGDSDPSKATLLDINTTVNTSVGGLDSDPWDWWEIRGGFDTAIIKVLLTERATDVILHVYEPNKLKNEWLREDQTVEGMEVLEVNSRNGESVIFRVQPYYHEGVDPSREFPYIIEVEDITKFEERLMGETGK